MSCGEQTVVREVEAACGNGTVEAGEECDDGNSENVDQCSNGCEVARCGDGLQTRAYASRRGAASYVSASY